VAASDDYAVVVGINDYGEPPGALVGAKRDAQDFIDWLKSGDGGDLPPQNVDPFVSLSDAGGKEPTLSSLLVLLVKVRKLAVLPKKRIGRRLYIFLAGHGISPPADLDETGLVTIEAQDQLMPNIPGKQSADEFMLSGRFDEVLLFMDCCRVTDLLLKKGTNPFVEKSDTKAAGNGKRFYVFAAAFGKPAREIEEDKVTRGIFSRVLIEGLKGGATSDPGGRLTTTQLRAYLERRMKAIIIDGEEQVPKFPSADEIVLREGVETKRVTINVTFSAAVITIDVLDGVGYTPVALKDEAVTAAGRSFSVPADRTYLLVGKNAGGDSVAVKPFKAEGGTVDVTV